MKAIWQKIQGPLKVIVSLSLITWLIFKIDFQEFVRIMKEGNPVYFIFGIIALVIGFFFQSYRLHLLIRSMTSGLGHSLKIFFIGFFFNNLLPSSIGGDAVRMYYLKKSGNTQWETPFSMLFFHRLVGFLVLFTAGLIYTLFRFQKVYSLLSNQLSMDYSPSALQGIIIGGVAIGLLIVFYTLRNKIKDFLKSCQRALALLKVWEYLAVFLLAAAFHFFRMIAFFLILKYFNQSIVFVDLAFILFATAMIALIPISLGGLGVVEGTLAALLGIYGVMGSAGIGLALINRAFLILISIVGGFFYMTKNINPSGEGDEEVRVSKKVSN